MKKYLINHRSPHHATHSGYDRIVDFLDTEVISGIEKPISYTLAKKITSLCNQNTGYYDTASVFKEIELLKRIVTKIKEDTVIHFACGERDFRFSSNWTKRKINIKTCGTFHKPESVLLDKFPNTKYLSRFDGAIAVSECQVEFLKSWLKIDKVKYIPHGVDTDFFEPDYLKKKSNTLLFVGVHLRDFEMFNKIIGNVINEIPELKVNAVVPKWAITFFNKKLNINFYSNISDLELKNLYQESNALFLPLKDVTACNAILEAMASGLPIITSDVGGNKSYLKGTSNILYHHQDESYLLDATLNLLKNEDIQLELGNSSRLKSLEYDWKHIAPRFFEFYDLLFE